MQAVESGDLGVLRNDHKIKALMIILLFKTWDRATGSSSRTAEPSVGALFVAPLVGRATLSLTFSVWRNNLPRKLYNTFFHKPPRRRDHNLRESGCFKLTQTFEDVLPRAGQTH